jgi:hypothetical protein
MPVSMTFGTMPAREQFDAACAAVDEDDGRSVEQDGFGFGNDPRLGTCRLTADELWGELQKAHAEFECRDGADDPAKTDAVGDWISSVLSCLGIEWV